MNEEFFKKIVKNIKELMIEKNISKRKLAKKSGHSIEYINRILNGELLLCPIELEIFAKILGTTKKQLMGYKEGDNNGL